MPKVSVVTALYNRSRYLRPRVEAILQQTLRDFEWIVIDDHSTDGTFEQFQRLTRSDRRILLLRNATNIGQGPTTKKAFELTRGDYIYLTDDDDVCHPTFLERMTAVLDAHQNVGLAYCQHLYMDAKGGTWGAWPPRRSYVSSGESEFCDLLRKCYIQSPSSILRRTAAERGGVFRTFVPPHNVDYHCYLKLCLVSDVAFLRDPLAYYRLHSEQSLKTKFRAPDIVTVQEKDSFDLITDVFLHLREDRRHLRPLESQALWWAADSLRFNFLRLHREGMEDTARALEAMIRRRVPDYPIGRLRPGLIRRARLALRELGLRGLKRATYQPPRTSAGTRTEVSPRASLIAMVRSPSFSSRTLATRKMAAVATILVPVRNQRPEWLEQCVRSAAGQTLPTEVLVVTAHDTSPATGSIFPALQRRSARLRILRQRGTGFANAINAGIRAATTDRVGLLLSDDWLEPTAVELCLSHEADIVSTGLRVFSADGETELTHLSRKLSQRDFEILPTLEQKASYLKHFLLFQRSALLAVGGVDPKVGLTGPDDFDMIWCLLEANASVRVVHEPLYNYRDHTEERLTLRSAGLQIADLCKILDKHGVHGAEREAVIRRHSPAYGRTLQEAALYRADLARRRLTHPREPTAAS